MAPSYIIAVMGVTGAGKSSFIKLVTGDASVKIGHSQESGTEHSVVTNLPILKRK